MSDAQFFRPQQSGDDQARYESGRQIAAKGNAEHQQDHEKLLALVAKRVSDGRVLRLIRSMLKAGCMAEGKRLPTEQGTPQGGVISPILSNALLTPFDREMRHRGYRLTRYADDWVVTCRKKAEARQVLAEAEKILTTLGVTLDGKRP